MIDPRKFTLYLLNPRHPDHAHGSKWEAFQKIGYDVMSDAGRQQAANDIIAQIRDQLQQSSAHFSRSTETAVYMISKLKVTGLNGIQMDLETIWEYVIDQDAPRLITAIGRVLRKD